MNTYTNITLTWREPWWFRFERLYRHVWANRHHRARIRLAELEMEHCPNVGRRKT